MLYCVPLNISPRCTHNSTTSTIYFIVVLSQLDMITKAIVTLIVDDILFPLAFTA